MMSAILKFLHMSKDTRQEEPLDKIQMDAARDRLQQRGQEITESFDELSKMIDRMKRRRGKNGN